MLDIGEWPLLKTNNITFGLGVLRHRLLCVISSKINVHIVAISESIRQELKVNYGISSLLLPGLTRSVSPLNSFVIRAYDRSPIRFLFVGNRKEADGFSELLQALVYLLEAGYDFRLRIVGSITGSEIESMLTTSNRFREFFSTKLELLGFLSRSAYESQLRGSDLLVLPRPSCYPENLYTFPTRIVEAFDQGCAIATSNFGEIARYLQADADFVSLGNGTTPEIFTALSDMLSQRASLSRMKHMGVSRACTVFSAEKNLACLVRQVALLSSL